MLACAFGASLAVAAEPKWTELSAQRQAALKPLAGEWDSLSDLSRKKWNVVADRFPGMKPEEQKRVHARMAEWVRLTPEQRRVARENYKKSKTLPAEKKKEEWQQYQTLPDVQKQQLAAAVDQKKPALRKAERRELEGKVVKPSPQKPKIPRSASQLEPAGNPAARPRPTGTPRVSPASPAAPSAPVGALVPTEASAPAPPSAK